MILTLQKSHTCQNVYFAGSQILSLMEGEIKDKYQDDLTKHEKNNLDGDAHDLNFSDWWRGKFSLETSNAFERKGLEYYEKGVAKQKRQSWLKNLIHLVRWNVGISNKLKGTRADLSDLKRDIAQDLAQTYQKFTKKLDERNNPNTPSHVPIEPIVDNSDLENESTELLTKERKLFDEGRTMNFSDIIATAQLEKDLEFFAESKEIETPDHLITFFQNHGLAVEQKYQYYESKYSASGLNPKGLLGFFMGETDRIVVFPSHAAFVYSVSSETDVTYPKYRKKIIYNEVMHKILFHEFLKPEDFKIDFKKPDEEEEKMMKSAGILVSNQSSKSKSEQARRELIREFDMTETQIDKNVAVLQENEFLSDFASLQTDPRGEVDRILNNQIALMELENPYAQYTKTCSFMMEKLKTKFNEEEILEDGFVENISNSDLEFIQNSYQEEANSLISRWKADKASGEFDQLLMELFRKDAAVT